MIMLRSIMEGKYSFSSPEWADISGKSWKFLHNKTTNFFFCFLEPPKDLIRKLLVVDPKQRISINDALEHPFFQMAVCIFS